MNKKDILIIILVIILVAIIATTLFITFSDTEEKTLGKETYGSVVRLGPFGNTSSDVKIAYVVGVHPQEKVIHEIFLDEFSNKSNLKYCYYIYKINVTTNIDDYETGRMNGQLLARDYVLPDALDMNYSLVVDVHANWGNWDENQFVFSPVNGGNGEKLANKILEDCTFSTYYYPPNPTSHVYLTQPLNEAGVPAFFWEEYVNNTPEIMKIHVNSLINAVDNLNF